MEDIMYLDDSDLNETFLKVDPQKNAIIMIKSDQCGYCIQTVPVFKRFCEIYSKQYTCAFIDVNDPRGIAFLKKLKYNVSGVPDFIRFKNGLYQPGRLRFRTVEGFLEFVK
jgi:thiol-disulfide isomerase/thioredoxin